MRTLRTLIVLICLAMVGGGCQLIRPGSLQKVQPVSDRPVVGNVYLVRGLIGVFSFGMDDLAEMLEARNIRCNVYQDVQAKQLASELRRKYARAGNREPIVLVGHSLGADDVIDIAHTLDEANVPVDLLVTVDAVNPRAVPKNVRLALNYYKPHALDAFPALRGIPIEPEVRGTVPIRNMSLTENRRDLMVSGTNHFNIDKNPRVHEDIIGQVLQVCRPRGEWVRAHQLPPGTPERMVSAEAATAAAPARTAVLARSRVPAAVSAPGGVARDAAAALSAGVEARDASARRN